MENNGRRLEDSEKKQITGVQSMVSVNGAQETLPLSTAIYYEQIDGEESLLSSVCAHEVPTNNPKTLVTQTCWLSAVVTTQDKKSCL